MEPDDTEPKTTKILNNQDEDNKNENEHEKQQQQYETELTFSNNNDDIFDVPGIPEEVLPFPDFRPIVFRCLAQSCKPRYWALKLITWPWFEKISLLVVIVNCITMGMHQPCETECNTVRCRFLAQIDDFIYVFFVLEMLIKIFAMGLCGSKSYLSDTWNRLDCFIVLAG